MRSFIIGFISAVVLCAFAIIYAYSTDAGGLREAAILGDRAVAAQRELALEYRRLEEEYRIIRDRDIENVKRLEQLEGQLSEINSSTRIIGEQIAQSGSLTAASRKLLAELDEILRRATFEVQGRKETAEMDSWILERSPGISYTGASIADILFLTGDKR